MALSPVLPQLESSNGELRIGDNNALKLTDAEIAAEIAPEDQSYEPEDIRRYGAQKTASNAENKAALQRAISRCSGEGATSGGVVIVPNNINYGYKIDDPSTHPDFSACEAPCLVIDYGPGNSFAGYPTIYDGAELRHFYFTPPTVGAVTFSGAIASGATSKTLAGNWTDISGPQFVTFSNGDVRNVTFTNGATTATWSSGLTSGATASATRPTYTHVGNTHFLRGAWNPGLFLVNDAVLGSPSSSTRTSYDNRRCQLSFGTLGLELWKFGQGTLQGASLTDEEMSNFALQKIAVPGDTLGTYVPYVIERKTGNWSFGSGGNVPGFSYSFYSVSAGYDQALFENAWDVNSRILLRPSTGSTDDAGLGMNATTGQLSLFFRSTGDALLIDKASRRVTFARAMVASLVAVSYSASITFSASDGTFYTITATNGTAFTINAPTSALTGIFLTVTIRNTSGGALGVATWNAVFKMSAWTQPANANSRSITFRFDNTNWVEMSRTPADVPN